MSYGEIEQGNVTVTWIVGAGLESMVTKTSLRRDFFVKELSFSLWILLIAQASDSSFVFPANWQVDPETTSNLASIPLLCLSDRHNV